MVTCRDSFPFITKKGRNGRKGKLSPKAQLKALLLSTGNWKRRKGLSFRDY
jgi:hypothetical protein